ncbi:MAG: DUF1553 domain-containing protein [Pirellulales bacterium]
MARMLVRLTKCGMLLTLWLGTCSGAQLTAADAVVQFDRDIAPILAKNCYECHGPDEKKREAGLRLDSQASATRRLESGKTAIVAGVLANSELYARITSNDTDERMPPIDSARSLTAREIDLIRRWIEQGAVWRKHWSLNPLRQVQLPSVSDVNWPRTAVDRFILARLERAGLTPAPSADRFTLLRRAYFDLIGLPPTSQQVESFIRDKSPGGYERLVDQLLASPHYGERWGRHWLDVARYGDSNGGDENHAYPHAFHYRDWVIAALNRDLPYDRFVALQLAGDLLPADPAMDENNLAATGFLAIGMKILAEKDKTKMRSDMVDEQLDTFGKSFLGLSIGCARCHDHKFDPIPTKDYYALAGIFHSTSVSDRPLSAVEDAGIKQRRERRIKDLRAEIDQINGAIDQQIKEGEAIVREAEKFDRGNVIVDDANYGKGIGIISDPGAQKNFAEYDFDIVRPGQYVVQLRYAAEKSRPGRLVINGKTVNDRAIAKVTGSWFPETQTWFSEGAGELVRGKNVLRLESEPMMSHIDKVRLISETSSGELIKRMKRIEKLTATLSELDNSKPQKVTVMAVSDGATRNVRIHRRGSHLDLGEEVDRGFLRSLSTADRPKIADQRSGRLQLVQWLVDRSSPASHLLARVIVNRVWHWHFGRGIVATPNDFGVRGRWPTHPELLDYLANRLIDDDWSLKELHRSIVTSQTYRMSSAANSPKATAVDSANRLLWKQRRRRLEAEVIRDAMFSVAGQLESRIGGKPVAVKSGDPSPEDLRKNRMAYDKARQRSVYLPVVRTNVYRFFTLFDFPNAATPVGKRSETIIATQALFVMNSPLFAELSGRLADRLLADGSIPDDSERINELVLLLHGRPATDSELKKFESFLKDYGTSVDVKLDVASRRREAWRALCHVLLGSNEFMYVN